jgi:heat shock protein HtpX
MQWDLWNPWARYHELHSTHPLVARRLDYLGEQAASLRQDPYVIFDRKKPESYWDEFLVDVGMHLLPLIAGMAVVGLAIGTGDSILQPMQWIGVGLLAVGTTSLVRVLFAYRGSVSPYLAVSSLLRKVKVSSIRPVPARVRGTIIGKGVAGLVWSEDFILQDPTGILFLDYRQPLRIWDWLFGLLRAGGYQGTEVEVEGWYRRAPVPYLEIKTLKADGKSRRCYTYHVKIAVALVLAAAGILILLT